MANQSYNFKYVPLTGKLPGASMVKQTEQAINELAQTVNEGSGQIAVITNLANQANDNAAEALEKANEALETSGRVYITLPSLDDADNYFDSQLYYFANSYSHNLPVQGTGFLEVKTNDTKTACEQVFIADSTGHCYFRHGDIRSEEVGSETVYSVTWKPWSSELASEDYVQRELTNYLSLNGGTITGDLIVDGTVDVKSGSNTAVNTLQRETAYNVDDIVYTSELNARYYLLCVTAGTTASTLPSFSGATSNAQITDGTVVWRVQTVTSQEKAKTYTDVQVSAAVPTGCVQAFAGNTLPDGWLLCDGSAVDRTLYAALFTAIGTTYGSGDGETTFNLPNLVDKFIEGSATSGTEKSAGLPKINTGYFQSPTNFVGGDTWLTGGSTTNVYASGTASVYNIGFSPGDDNGIYGNSSTVQPPALTMRYIIKY